MSNTATTTTRTNLDKHTLLIRAVVAAQRLFRRRRQKFVARTVEQQHFLRSYSSRELESKLAKRFSASSPTASTGANTPRADLERSAMTNDEGELNACENCDAPNPTYSCKDCGMVPPHNSTQSKACQTLCTPFCLRTHPRPPYASNAAQHCIAQQSRKNTVCFVYQAVKVPTLRRGDRMARQRTICQRRSRGTQQPLPLLLLLQPATASRYFPSLARLCRCCVPTVIPTKWVWCFAATAR
jgi:hypothetical protein